MTVAFSVRFLTYYTTGVPRGNFSLSGAPLH
jgi:hypothetical protein